MKNMTHCYEVKVKVENRDFLEPNTGKKTFYCKSVLGAYYLATDELIAVLRPDEFEIVSITKLQ